MRANHLGNGVFEIFGIPSQALFSQLLIGLINGSFYALLSLGLAVIFGMLNIINFTHGAQYMMGAFTAFLLLQYFGANYWVALVLVPIIIGFTGVLMERNLISQLNSSDPRRTIVFLATIAIVLLVATLILGIDTVPAVAIAVACGFVAAELWGWFGPSSDATAHVDHLYGLLLTFGLALIIEG